MRFYPFVFLPERMRTACDRSEATGKSPRKGKRISLNEINYNEQRDKETILIKKRKGNEQKD
jgi:hypothetical protein